MRRSEIKGMQMLVDALKGLTAEERERAVEWAYRRYVEAPRAKRKEHR
jgi:hypothetical protein